MNTHALPTGPNEFYRTLVESAAEGMLTIDDESTIVYGNPAIQEILGYSPAELVGGSKMRIIPDRLRAAHEAALAQYVETGIRNIDWDGIELPALHKDGYEVPTRISIREPTKASGTSPASFGTSGSIRMCRRRACGLSCRSRVEFWKAKGRI